MIFTVPISTIFLILNLQKSVRNTPVSQPTTSTSLQSRQTGLNSSLDGGKCYSYMIVGARGTMEEQGAGSPSYNSLIERALSSVPNGANYDVVYSSSMEYSVTPKEGAADGMKHVKAIMSECPTTRFVFLGYSKGAMVVTQMLADESLPPSKVVAVALFGNPYFTSDAPQNKCSAKTGQGIASKMLVVPLPEYQDRIFDCCHLDDMICQTEGGVMAHLNYRIDGAPQAVQFILDKLKAMSTSANSFYGDVGVQFGTEAAMGSLGSEAGLNSNQAEILDSVPLASLGKSALKVSLVGKINLE